MLSSQRKWQLNKQSKGLCTICGRRKIFKNNHCKACYIKSLEYQKDYHLRNKNKHNRMMAEWRKNNPDYAKKYYLKLKNKA